MANDAFALSPISARAAQPSEEDYDAISTAFLETSRGRWFLGEYAKRNRNADTRMVLDAVARIEQNIASQQQPVPETGLADALAAIKTTLGEARTLASTAIEGLAIEEHLAPVHRGIRVIKEISWRWREIGADGRICDLIDLQLKLIEASCEQLTSADPREELNAAFDLLDQRVAECEQPDKASSEATTEASATVDAPTLEKTEMAAAASEPTAEVVSASAEIEMPAAEETISAAHSEDIQVTQPADAVDAIGSMEDMAADEDDALLDMIALEMAAPDPLDAEIEAEAMRSAEAHADDFDFGSEVAEISTRPIVKQAVAVPAVTKPAVTMSSLTAAVPAPAVMINTPALPPVVAAPATVPASPPDRMIHPATPPALPEAAQPSLGSALVANGIVRPAPTPANDPLGPIRRMSQAEKIAFFS